MKVDALRVTYFLGVCFVIAGGLVAAVTGPLDLARGSWLAAYSVLVGGVAQCALAVGHTVTGAPAPTSQMSWIRLAGWNLGNLLVIVGALLRVPILVDIGAVPLVVALVLTLRSTRHARRRILAVGYRLVLLVLIASIPIGVTLSHARAVAAPAELAHAAIESW
ncbi:hypothetical protein BJI47_21405 [Rhodococcus sp. 1168]|nr:hypothetical protein BJI47_21405 [Rhodococcus sp. 1168]